MRKIIVSTFLSLDGVMQAPGGPGEDPDGGFNQEGWSVNYWDDRMGQIMDEFMGTPFDLLLGRKTYEIFAAHWPHASDEEGAGPLNRATKYVVSTTLASADWGPAVLIGEDVVERITRLKQEDGPDLQVHGSSQLIQTLIAHDLVDEYRLLIFPLLLGRGKRLFGDGVIPAGLRLVDTTTSTTGVVIATYERAGGINLGSFALDQPTAAEVERPR
ncbi:MAG: dihydrofolate reductase family protein [Chloroflexota bacterium]|nr:dihydrofolate reductase family protein [Chloroflexota bacterium]